MDVKRKVLRWGKEVLEGVTGVEVDSKHFYPHLKRLRSWAAGDVVFDVGANDGRTVVRLRRHLKAPTIYAFEPVTTTFQHLTQQTSRLSKVHCFPYALGEREETKEIYLNEVGAVNSFDPAWGGSGGTERVQVTTVDRVMQQHGIDFIHFLKVDTEGHDLAVLKGAHEALTASRVGIIQVEAGVDQVDRPFTTIEEFRRHLAPYGYYLYGIFNQARRRARPPADWEKGYRLRTLAYCDAVFVRAELT